MSKAQHQFEEGNPTNGDRIVTGRVPPIKGDADYVEPTPESLPVIPDAASAAIVAAVAQARAAQQNVQATVALVLATLGLSIETHDVSIEDGKAVIKHR